MKNNLNWSLEDAVEIVLPDADAFLKIKETLRRIGIPSHKTKTLYQTAHILHKRGKYYIIHFKCLFALDGKPALFDVLDYRRQNTIAKLLTEWGLCDMVYEYEDTDFEDARNIKVIKHSEKGDWNLVSKYSIGT